MNIVPHNNYVQPVPDHCDRIVWRNHYYHLPLSNPRLSAAAPELLEALRMARQIGDGVSRGFLAKFYAVADAAIAKATGEQS